MLHASARSTPHTRQLLARRVLEEGWPVGLAAKAVGLSRKAARKWIGRSQTEGEQGLFDRSSAPRSIPHRTSNEYRRAAQNAMKPLRPRADPVPRSTRPEGW